MCHTSLCLPPARPHARLRQVYVRPSFPWHATPESELRIALVTPHPIPCRARSGVGGGCLGARGRRRCGRRRRLCAAAVCLLAQLEGGAAAQGAHRHQRQVGVGQCIYLLLHPRPSPSPLDAMPHARAMRLHCLRLCRQMPAGASCLHAPSCRGSFATQFIFTEQNPACQRCPPRHHLCVCVASSAAARQTPNPTKQAWVQVGARGFW